MSQGNTVRLHRVFATRPEKVFRAFLDADAMAKAEAIVQAHIAARPDIMAVPAAERAAAHPNFS